MDKNNQNFSNENQEISHDQLVNQEIGDPNIDQPEKHSPEPNLKGYMKTKFGIWILVLLLVANSIFVWQVLKSNDSDKSTNAIKDITEISNGGVKLPGDLTRVSDAYNYISKSYFSDVDQQKMIDGAIKGMMDSLEDPFSEYMSAEQAKQFTEQISGSFEGIGAEINSKENKIVIVSPIKGSPAEAAGLKPNDIVVSADGTSLDGLTATEAVKLIKGPKGSAVKLVIERPGQAEPIEVEIIRDTISVKSVEAKMLENDVAHISVSIFSQDTAKEFKDSLQEMQDKGMKSLILDFRGNPGGLLNVAESIADCFVPEGKIIVQTEEKDGDKTPDYATSNKGFKVEVPLVVLIDNGSASASEVVAAALHDSANAKLVGVKSYGKGTIQTTKNMKDQSEIKLTIGKWLTPKGVWVHKEGIVPDIESKLPDYANVTMINPSTQLDKGNISADTENAEKMLVALGYEPGTVNNVFDEATATAVTAFQKDNNIAQTGILSGETTTRLMEKIRTKLQEDDVQLKAAIEALK